MSISDKILDAIELLATNSVEKAGYDKTIQAQVISCEDATIGKYKCRYQDAIIYAYSNSSEITFNNGAYVYILVPSNDMKKEKTILGTTNKLGINYISQVSGDEAYDIIGNNCITSDNIFYLNTINKDYKYTLYEYGNESEVTLDVEALNQYIKQSSSLIVGAIFKTTIPLERQYRGHYGIIYNLRFLDNTSNNQVIRSYTIDEDNMIDNPYRLLYETRQYEIFDIDGSNFIRVESIEIFNKDFPNATENITDEKLTSGDIEITALELKGAVRMSEEEMGGVAISFYTPQGTFFSESSTSASYKTITAQVKIKGKLASTAQNIPFYWGTEHVGITPSSEYYNKYLGRGWKCLNDKNVIEAGTETTDPVIQWVPSKDTYIFNFNEATAKNNKLKVAIVYDGNVITKKITVQNLKANIPNLIIESSDGTKFYYDIGHPTLTCKVNGEELLNYEYYWAYENNVGVFNELPVTITQNIQYNNAVTTLNNLKTAIENGTKFANAEAENLNNAETAVKAFNFIQRIEGNKIYDVQINNITSFGIFKCSVFDDEGVYLGTASITLTNSLEREDLYSLVINNGTVVFQYNENGVAPNNKSLDVQQQIQGLSFTIYDNLGQPIDSDIISNTKNCKIRWQFPIKNSMLVDQEGNKPDSGTDVTGNYKYYDNKINLIYDIAQRYDIKKQRNQIKLTVDYKGMNLTAETEFTFTKQGEPGTNGTEYLVKLVPNTRMTNPPLWPMITKAGGDYILNYGLNSTAQETIIGINTGYQLFKAQLWHSGDLVWQGMTASTAASDGVTKPSAILWQVLKNKYKPSTFDDSAFTVINSENGQISYTGDHLNSAFETPLANIIKCTVTWQDKLYYGTIPITTAWTSSENYRVNLKDYTGFRYAIYTSDGMTPQYDNSSPFEFICMEKINDIWEDVSTVNGSHKISYTPSSCGNVKTTQTGTIINSSLLNLLSSSVYREGLNDNQWVYRPVSRYDGQCVNAAVICTYKQNNVTIGKINIPIHFLLNKYGLSNINSWDGNSVQIDSDGGYILSPQMGAGIKDNNNNFTGVLMGQVKTPVKNSADIGLFGYNNGDRTFFLNSQNGSALFGKANNGQFIIDPTNNKALLYSGNFWKNYNVETGLPENYTYRNNNYQTSGNGNGAGLLIDLTTPEIYFGNGNFYVTSEGILHATGANISGKITATELNLEGIKIPSDDISGLPNFNIYIQKDGQVGNTPGLTTTGFIVSSGGALTASNAIIYGTLYSSAGKIGGWTLAQNSLYTGSSASTEAAALSTATDGSIALSTTDFTRTINNTSLNTLRIAVGSKFGVDKTGKIYAGGADLAGKITATSGTIGGFTISSTNDASKTSANGGHTYVSSLYAHSGDGTYEYEVGIRGNGNSTTQSDIVAFYVTRITKENTWVSTNREFTFYVRKDGHLYATSANITGAITATSGYIGTSNNGLVIDNYGFYFGSKTDNSEGYLALSNNDFSRTINGTSRSGLRFAIGSNFGVSKSGVLYAGSAIISGAITATSGAIGANTNKINIKSDSTQASAIYYGMDSLNNTTNNGFYLGADGIALGGGKFKVTSGGNLVATSATITGAINATSGDIGASTASKIHIGTHSSKASIYSGMTELADTTNNGFYLGTDGIALGKGTFKVTSDGKLTATQANIEGSAIISGGSVSITSSKDSFSYIKLTSNKYTTEINSGKIIVSDGNSNVQLNGEGNEYIFSASITKSNVKYNCYFNAPYFYVQNSSQYGIGLNANGTIEMRAGAGGPILELFESGKLRVQLTQDGLFFKNAQGATTKIYSAT